MSTQAFGKDEIHYDATGRMVRPEESIKDIGFNKVKNEYLDKRKRAYIEKVKKDPSQQEHLEGWLKRLKLFREKYE